MEDIVKEVPLFTIVRSGPEGTVLTPEDGETLVGILNADDPEGHYVMVFQEDGNVMVTDLNDMTTDGEFLFI